MYQIILDVPGSTIEGLTYKTLPEAQAAKEIIRKDYKKYGSDAIPRIRKVPPVRNPTHKIYELIAKHDIIKADYLGCGALDYCTEHNLFHIDTPEGGSVYCRDIDYDWTQDESEHSSHSFDGRNMSTIELYMQKHPNLTMYEVLTKLKPLIDGGYFSGDFVLVNKNFY